MTVLLKICLITFSLYIFNYQECGLLSNGEYKFIETIRNPQTSRAQKFESRLVIRDGSFSRNWNNGDSSIGKLEWIYDCTFKLRYLNRQNNDTSDFGKLLLKSFGVPCYEIKEKKGDTIKFRTTYTGNLHITTSEGLIIKIR